MKSSSFVFCFTWCEALIFTAEIECHFETNRSEHQENYHRNPEERTKREWDPFGLKTLYGTWRRGSCDYIQSGEAFQSASACAHQVLALKYYHCPCMWQTERVDQHPSTSSCQKLTVPGKWIRRSTHQWLEVRWLKLARWRSSGFGRR